MRRREISRSNRTPSNFASRTRFRRYTTFPVGTICPTLARYVDHMAHHVYSALSITVKLAVVAIVGVALPVRYIWRYRFTRGFCLFYVVIYERCLVAIAGTIIGFIATRLVQNDLHLL